MKRHRIVSIVGTRPEVIKMAPVVRELERRKHAFEHTLVTTAQHREMLDQVLEAFDLKPEIDLGLMEKNQSLAEFASRALVAVSRLLTEMKPDAVLVQGDTTTVMTAALAAYYQNVRVGHVEAGLRSFDRRNPFPEEINRRIAGTLADFHFAPTERARQNLLQEGVSGGSVFVTGNTIVDALNSIALGEGFDDSRLEEIDSNGARLLLVTAHRRENHGEPLRSICHALKKLTARFEDVQIVYPVHLNPSVRTLVNGELGGIARIHLVEPLSYRDLLRLMSRCRLILTDSGGIQEEAPSFRKPLLVLREVTERPELIEANGAVLVGTTEERIVETAARLLTDADEYAKMVVAENPFGDGQAATRIADILEQRM